MQLRESAQVVVTYGLAQAVTPVECGWTRADHNRQNPKQILQSPQTHPRWIKNTAVHTGAAWGLPSPLSHWNEARKRGNRQTFSCSRPYAPGSHVRRDLSSPQSVNPPIHLSPKGRSAHPGLAALERRCSLSGTFLMKHRTCPTAAIMLRLFNGTSVLTFKIRWKPDLKSVTYTWFCSISQTYFVYETVLRILPFKCKYRNQKCIETILNVQKKVVFVLNPNEIQSRFRPPANQISAGSTLAEW